MVPQKLFWRGQFWAYLGVSVQREVGLGGGTEGGIGPKKGSIQRGRPWEVITLRTWGFNST